MREIEHSGRPENIIGIDLGTTEVRVARFNEAGKPQITNNAEGSDVTPAVIQIEGNGTAIIGTEAKKFLGTGTPNVFTEFKREMGTDKSWQVGADTVSPIKLSALLLKKVVADYAEQFGQPQSVVITWPANYRNEQREATKDAAARAGLKVEYFIEEPIAIGLYYAAEIAFKGKYLIYDFGGGTFEVTLIQVSGNSFITLRQDGIGNFSTKEFDAAILKIVSAKFSTITGSAFDAVDSNFDRLSIESIRGAFTPKDSALIKLKLARGKSVEFSILREELERKVHETKNSKQAEELLKILVEEKLQTIHSIGVESVETKSLEVAIKAACFSLTPRSKTSVRVVSVSFGPVAIEILREEFESETSYLISQIEATSLYTLQSSGIPAQQAHNDISGILMAGELSRLPSIRNSVEKLYGKRPTSRNPEQAIAMGAAIYAARVTDLKTLNSLQRRAVEDVDVVFMSPDYFGLIYTNWLTGESKNITIISRGEILPVTRTFKLKSDISGYLPSINVTQSAIEETNPEFVTTIWKGELQRCSANSDINLVFDFSKNGFLSISMIDLGTGRSTKVELHLGSHER